MNNQNVIALPASTSYTPEQALQSALNESLTDVLIIGYDNDGELVIRSSKMSRMDALWMTEKAKEWALRGGVMTDALLMDMVYVGCGVIFGLIVRKLVVTYCKRPWVGLTEDEALALGKQYYHSPVSLMYAVEAKLKEKNHD